MYFVQLIAEVSSGTLLTILGIVAAPIGAYFIAVRQFSGSIKSSEASVLWKESESIRTWATERMQELEHENDELRKQVDHCRDKAVEMGSRIAELERRLATYEGDTPGFLQ